MLAALAAAVFFIQQILMMGGRRKRRRKRQIYSDEFISDMSHRKNCKNCLEFDIIYFPLKLIMQVLRYLYLRHSVHIFQFVDLDNLDSAIDATKLAKAIAMISNADNSGSLSSSLLNKLCNCDGNIDIMGLGLAALATGVVYIIITRDNGERRKRRRRRNYDLNYGDNSFVYGM